MKFPIYVKCNAWTLGLPKTNPPAPWGPWLVQTPNFFRRSLWRASLSLLTASPLPISNCEFTSTAHLTVCGLVVEERHVFADQTRLPLSAILA